MRHGSLFSGIGGFDLAAWWMGWENIFNVEIDPFCRKVLKTHFPSAKQFKDIRKFDGRQYYGAIEIISGGFPCQPFSLAGQRLGSQDNRYLWPEMLRVIDEIRPSWIVGENVAGILSLVQPGVPVDLAIQTDFSKENQEIITEHEFIVETICKDIERIGYSVQPFLIPACSTGAPHRRNRVWFIAHFKGTILRPKSSTVKSQSECSTGFDTASQGGLTPDSNGQRQPGSRRPANWSNTKKNPPWKTSWADDVSTWPSQPTVCRGDDGVPGSLVNIPCALRFA